VFFTEEDVRMGRPEEYLEAAGEGRSEDEHWVVRKDGSRFWAGTVLTALHDDEGELRGFSEVTQDITEKKKAERLREGGARPPGKCGSPAGHGRRTRLRT